MPKKSSTQRINQVVVISDLHAGCQFGLCPPDGITLDGGGHYEPSDLQKKVWQWWLLFWNEWVPNMTRGEPFGLEINGDMIDGRHHNATTQVSQNIADQKNIAQEILEPIVDRVADNGGGKALFVVRGTEAHVGQAGENEEMLAESLGAQPDATGNYSRHDMFLRLKSDDGCLIHFNHHIGTTGRTHYETSALMAELGEALAEAGRWGEQAPDVIVRSHRHRHIKIEAPAQRGMCIGEVTPGWQLKTPLVYRIPGGRNSTPQFGGILIRHGDREFYTVHFVRNVRRTAEVAI